MMKKIRVLVVDDSAFMRKIISDMLSSNPEIEVVGTAADGREALAKVSSLDPDVVTMDLDMPLMDGITALKHIMKVDPKPVIMVSAFTYDGAEETIKSLNSGAVDFVTKPDRRRVSFRMKDAQEELIKKIKSSAKANMFSSTELSKCKQSSKKKKKKPLAVEAENVVVIGASTGGPKTLCKIMSKLPTKIDAAVIVVQHMPPKFTLTLASWLDSLTSLPVVEARDGEMVTKGKVFIAPGGFHLKVKKEKVNDGIHRIMRLDKGPMVNGMRPSIDVTMSSVAQAYTGKVVGVILTGMGHDGTEGMKQIKRMGGRTISQDEDTSIISSMPKSAFESGAVDEVVSLPEISKKILELISS
ncbi:MAG: chemotaxis response regulator protein-glutamate methylesterase [Candidatus Altiarchaeales archaeon ex4484_2]|nr:MAG: chemotaxis response regulator protein-glutamate methylesterase [Candidatus Altiarchaeales archaeon ex4484_2]